jgi:hypothetical protein
MYVFSQIPATDTVTDILLHTTSITSLFSIVLSVMKNRNAINRIILLVSEIDSIILPCSRNYYSKPYPRLINQFLVLCIFLAFTITCDYITCSLVLRLKIFSYCQMYAYILIDRCNSAHECINFVEKSILSSKYTSLKFIRYLRN